MTRVLYLGDGVRGTTASACLQFALSYHEGSSTKKRPAKPRLPPTPAPSTCVKCIGDASPETGEQLRRRQKELLNLAHSVAKLTTSPCPGCLAPSGRRPDKTRRASGRALSGPQEEDGAGRRPRSNKRSPSPSPKNRVRACPCGTGFSSLQPSLLAACGARRRALAHAPPRSCEALLVPLNARRGQELGGWRARLDEPFLFIIYFLPDGARLDNLEGK